MRPEVRCPPGKWRALSLYDAPCGHSIVIDLAGVLDEPHFLGLCPREEMLSAIVFDHYEASARCRPPSSMWWFEQFPEKLGNTYTDYGIW